MGWSSENRGTDKERLLVVFSRPELIEPAIRKLLRQIKSACAWTGKTKQNGSEKRASVYTLEKEKGGYPTDFYSFRSERGP